MEGTYIQGFAKHGKENQKWRIIYLDEKEKGQQTGLNKARGMHINRPFYIVSKLWMNRVISVAGGYNLVIQTRKTADDKRQQWYYEEKSKTIKSVQFKDRSIDIRGGNAYAYKTDSRWYQLWKYDGGWFVNEQKQVLAVQSKTDSENRQVVREARNAEEYQ